MQTRSPFRNPLVLVLALSGALFLVLIAASFLFASKMGMIGNHGAKAKSGIFSGDGIGVLEVNGVIMDSKRWIKSIEQFEEEDSIKAVVVRLNSPGGAVAPSQEVYQAIKRLAEKKPVYTSMQSVAASGAYYIAMGTQKVFANAGTMTGSIGVIMEFANLEKLYEWAKVKRYVVKTGKFKDSGSDTREMTAEERELFQRMVDNVLGQFKQAVVEGRKLTLAQVTQVADGRIFSGEQAKAIGLVDEIGTFRDAVDQVALAAKIKGKPELVYPSSDKKGWMDWVMNDLSGGGKDDDEESRASSSASVVQNWLARLVTGQKGRSPSALGPGLYWVWAGGV